MKNLLLLTLILFGTVVLAQSDSDGGYESGDPEISDRDPEVNDRDCEDCDPTIPEPEPEPEPAPNDGRGGTCSGCDPYNGR